MKKYLITIISYILPVLALANGAPPEEDAAVFTQLQELLPFEHIEEGHWLAFTLSILLWLSFVYAIFSLIQRFRKSKTNV